MSEVYEAYVRRAVSPWTLGAVWEIEVPGLGVTETERREDVRGVTETLVRESLDLTHVEVRLRWVGDYDA
jgi:hypothetical protein